MSTMRAGKVRRPIQMHFLLTPEERRMLGDLAKISGLSISDEARQALRERYARQTRGAEAE